MKMGVIVKEGEIVRAFFCFGVRCVWYYEFVTEGTGRVPCDTTVQYAICLRVVFL